MDRTNAERQRRYIARLKAAAKAQGGVTNADKVGKAAELRRQLAQANAEIEDLRAENKSLLGLVSARKAPPSETETKLRKTIEQLRRQLREVAAAPKGTVWITKAGAAKIRMALDPDQQQDPARKKLHTQALQIFETLALREIET